MKLDEIVPWGRTLEEYKSMFSLSETDLNAKILGCGDGPASFNVEMAELGYSVVGCVAKKEESDRLRSSHSKFSVPDVQVQPVQMVTLRSGNYPLLRPVVSELSVVLSPSRRNGERTRTGYSSHYWISLGTKLWTRTR